MERALKLNKMELYYYKDGKRISGYHDRIRGDVSGISGDLDECEITDADRQAGIDISQLVG